MKRIKTGLTGFILGDWLGMPAEFNLQMQQNSD